MKKILFFILAINVVYGYDIHTRNSKEVKGSCNGQAFSANKNGSQWIVGTSRGGNGLSTSLDEAIRQGCSKKSSRKAYFLKKHAVVCEKKSSMESLLEHRFRYDTTFHSLHKDCIKTKKRYDIFKLKTYSQKTWIFTDDDGTKSTIQHIDRCVKIKAGGETWYTRTNEIY